MEIKVMKVKSTHPESQGPFVLINESDFDAKVHEKYEEPKSTAKAAADKGTTTTTDDATGKGATSKPPKK